MLRGSWGMSTPRHSFPFPMGMGLLGGGGGGREKESPSGMRNYKASCSESPCVGMNRKICLSLFPHRPLSFHGLTFADGGWLLMQPQTFRREVFQPCLCRGWKEKRGTGGAAGRVGGSKGLFSLVVSCSWLRGSIAPRQSEARAANQLCQVPPAP